MPPPMTLDTMTAAASSGPRRRSSVGTLFHGGCCGWRGGQQVRCDRKLAHLHPGVRAVLTEDLDLHIDEAPVGENLRAPLIRAGVAKVPPQHQFIATLARRQPLRADRGCVIVAPRFRL